MIRAVALISTILIICTFVGSQPKTQDTLFWCSGCHLVWSDYKLMAPNSNPYHAGSTIGISYHFNSKSYELEIKAAFYPQKSWVKAGQETSHLLAHEQGHFDIAEIHARRLRKLVCNKKFKKETFQQSFKRMYDQVIQEMELMQEEYDNETNFSKNRAMQTSWNEMIKVELKEFSVWDKTNISVVIR